MQAGFFWDSPETGHPQVDTPEKWWGIMHTWFEMILIQLGIPPALSQQLAQQMKSIYTNLARWQLYEDSLPVLARLQAYDWQHILVSNHAPELRQIVTHLELMPYLAGMINSAESGYEKPNPIAFQLALQAAGHPKQVWMVGDNPRADVGGAQASGIPSILVRRNAEGVRYQCNTLEQAADLILIMDE
jgi:putative hydrolase of the HAD superfamily